MEEFLVITDMDNFYENIHYCGDNEFEAYKRYKEIKGKFPRINIVRAVVRKVKVDDTPFIMEYKVSEIIK